LAVVIWIQETSNPRPTLTYDGYRIDANQTEDLINYIMTIKLNVPD